MILCVDPDAAARKRTMAALSGAGFDVTGASTVAAATAALDDDAVVEGVVTEYDLPDGTGLELARRVRGRSPDATCVLFTTLSLEELETRDFGEVVVEYVQKDGGGHEELVRLVEHAVAFRSQTAYPLPADETARIAALEQYAVDPAALGESLDRLTELATALFDLNAAAVGLIDRHHQEFLSCHGVTFDPIDREETVCTYAILDEGVTVIEDLRDDPRFADNDGLRAANIRFYASAPLLSPDGQPIGTFCIYDDEPRSFDGRNRELLELLAAEAMEQLVLRSRLRETDEVNADD